MFFLFFFTFLTLTVSVYFAQCTYVLNGCENANILRDREYQILCLFLNGPDSRFVVSLSFGSLPPVKTKRVPFLPISNSLSIHMINVSNVSVLGTPLDTT
eukprot:106858_1